MKRFEWLTKWFVGCALLVVCALAMDALRAEAQTVTLSYKQFQSLVTSGQATGSNDYFQVLAGYNSTNSKFYPIAVDASGQLITGGSAPAALADATANPTISSQGAYLFGFNGSTWDRLRVDASKNLLVSLGTGLDGANDTVSIRVNNTAPAALADATANPTTIHVAADLIGFNGTTWDRVRLDAATGNLLVDQAGRTSIVTGSATCGNGSAVQFGSNAVKSVCFKNPGTNTVWVGGSGVAATTAFVQLATGETWCEDMSNTNLVYCIASGATQVLPFVGVN